MEALPKTGNKVRENRPRFRPRHCTAKPAPLVWWESVGFRGGPAPAPPASIKEQNQGRVLSGRKALSMGTWNSGRSGAEEHMPRKPVDKSRSPTLTRRVAIPLNGNLCHTASGGSFRGGTPSGFLHFGPSWPEVITARPLCFSGWRDAPLLLFPAVCGKRKRENPSPAGESASRHPGTILFLP